MRKLSGISLATALAFATMLTMSACGGANTTPVPSSPGSSSFNGPGPAGNAVVTAGSAAMNASPAAAPGMPNVLTAQVTIGSITAVNANGSTTAIMTKPAMVELTHLGTSSTLVNVNPLPQGTYNSVTFTITAAQVTYLKAGVVTVASTVAPSGGTANLTIPPTSATLTETFGTAVDVNWQNASQLALEFDLAQSLSVNSSTGMVTFAPSTTATVPTASVTLTQVAGAAPVVLHVNGTVTSTNDTNNSLVLMTDSGYNETVFATSTTVGEALGSLDVGAAVRTDATINADGSLTALTLETADNGLAETIPSGSTATAAAGTVDEGVVTAPAAGSASSTSFTMVVTNSTNSALVGQQITVDLNPGATTTVIAADPAAAYAGQNAKFTFDASQIFAGQAVWVAGNTDATSTKTNTIVDATNVMQSPVSLDATTAAVKATVGTDGTTDTAFLFPLAASFSGLPSGTAVAGTAVTCAAVGSGAPQSPCTAANLEGPYLSSTTQILKTPAGNTVGARGYLTQTGGINSLAIISAYDAAALPKP